MNLMCSEGWHSPTSGSIERLRPRSSRTGTRCEDLERRLDEGGFVMLQPVEENRDLILVVNWIEELRRRSGAGR